MFFHLPRAEFCLGVITQRRDIPCGIGLSLFVFGWRESLLPQGLRLLALTVALLVLLPLIWSGLHAFGHNSFPADHTH